VKYIVIVLEGKELIFTFPRSVDHDRMAESIAAIRFGSDRNWSRKLREGEVIAAGFIDSGFCHGHSETLGIQSRGEADTALMIDLVRAGARVTA
jgi:hypothetical protein